jgi:hypothetical protein
VLLKEAKRNYLKGAGVKCPYCGTDDIEAGPFDGEMTSVKVTCHGCQKEWYDIYKLVGITEADDENYESGIPITLDELADEVVLPEMLVYPGDKLDLDFIVEKAHHADHRANKENVRLALNHLEGCGDVIRSNKPDHWIAVRH